MDAGNIYDYSNKENETDDFPRNILIYLTRIYSKDPFIFTFVALHI